MPKLSVQLVVWNGARYLPYLFASLRKQSYQDWFLVIIDNGSTDNSVEIIKKELEDFSIPHKLIINKDNNGFTGGHTQAFELVISNEQLASEYILLLNQDMYLMPDCLEKMVEFLDKHSEAGAVTPRLMRWDFLKIGEGLEKSLTNYIDALGFKIFRNRRVVEDCTGQEWLIASQQVSKSAGQLSGCLADKLSSSAAREVFGVSGAFPMYRRSALIDTFLPDGDFLDSSYFMYKEDVDLAYRLASRGWKSYVLLDSVAYHDRAGAGPKELTDTAALKNKKSHSSWVKHHSYKNHLMTLYKNEYGQNFTLDFPWILWYEFKKFVYFLLFDRSVLAGLREVWKMRRELANKRRYIKRLRKIDWKQIRRWWQQ